MREARKTGSIILGALAVLMLVLALTAPMIVAATPAILALGFGLGAWAVWPRHPASSPTE